MNKPKLRQLLKEIGVLTKDQAWEDRESVKRLAKEIDAWRPEQGIIHELLALFESVLTTAKPVRRKRSKPSSGNSASTTPETPKSS
jgi:hypothetical protein